jgi:transcription antitermination factor NusA-like protein
MNNTINMQDMRHLNLFNQITKIRTRFCTDYNNAIIFCVPGEFIRRAVGEKGRNIKKISGILGKRVRVIQSPRGIRDAKGFISVIIKPIKFKDLQITDNEIILTAGNKQTKATLIGRDKRRFFEMQKIVKDFFDRDFKIV